MSTRNWYTQVVNGRNGKIESEQGPMEESLAKHLSDHANKELEIIGSSLYSRAFEEGCAPTTELPDIGDEVTVEELAAAISGDRPERMAASNLAFVRSLHMMLRINGIWGWPGTATFWVKTEKGFRRTV